MDHVMTSHQFAYRDNIEVEEAVLYLLHWGYTHLNIFGGYVRVMFFNFSSAFNTIKPSILSDKLDQMQVDSNIINWIADYLTGRPQFIRLRKSVSEWCAVLGLYRQPSLPLSCSSCRRQIANTTGPCHIQKYSDDTAIVACIEDGLEGEYRDLIRDFTSWSDNCFLLITAKTKELIMNFRRVRPPLQPVNIRGEEIEVLQTINI